MAAVALTPHTTVARRPGPRRASGEEEDRGKLHQAAGAQTVMTLTWLQADTFGLDALGDRTVLGARPLPAQQHGEADEITLGWCWREEAWPQFRFSGPSERSGDPVNAARTAPLVGEGKPDPDGGLSPASARLPGRLPPGPCERRRPPASGRPTGNGPSGLHAVRRRFRIRASGASARRLGSRRSRRTAEPAAPCSGE